MMTTTIHGNSPCPLCWAPLDRPFRDPDIDDAMLRCRNCGDRTISSSAVSVLLGNGYTGPDRARIAHGIQKLPHDRLVTTALLTSVLERTQLPGASERIDNLVRHLADRCGPGQTTELATVHLKASIGAATDAEVKWLFDEALQLRLIVGNGPMEIAGRNAWVLHSAVLTLQGWERYSQLMRDGAGSRHAFMAMKFGDAELDAVFSDHLRDAVQQTGFELRTVAGDHKTAGSIDNRMRVEIRTSRFLVCDLTHGNRGAYWEAGFAEGLGRPVFYVCRRDVLADRNHLDHPHFDTAHQLISTWSLDTIASDMQDMKQTIRNTLPAEAKMQDT